MSELAKLLSSTVILQSGRWEIKYIEQVFFFKLSFFQERQTIVLICLDYQAKCQTG